MGCYPLFLRGHCVFISRFRLEAYGTAPNVSRYPITGFAWCVLPFFRFKRCCGTPVEGVMRTRMGGVCKMLKARFFTCFTNVNQCRYRLVKTLESHGVLHWSGIFKIQRFALFGPFSSFFRAFSAGKAKTSDFLRQNHGCLPSKVPMFYLKKSDVLAAETRCFQHLLPSFRPFSRRTSCKTS